MNPTRILLSVSTICLSVVLPSGPAAAVDLLRPLDASFPPGIGISDVEATKEALPEADDPSYEDQLIELVNQERWNNGELAPLKRVDLLDNSSETHSTNMAARDFVMHCDPDTGLEFWQRIIAAGYSYNRATENIAWGNTTPAGIMAVWMASPPHEANILDTQVREMGNGYSYQSADQGNVRRTTTTSCTPNVFNEGPFYGYWTQNFGRRDSVYPVIINREAYLTESRDVTLYLYGGWTEMRLRNESDAWSNWIPFANNSPWQLSYGNGTKTVTVEMLSGSTVVSSSDTIILEGPSDVVFIDGFESGSTSSWSTVFP